MGNRKKPKPGHCWCDKKLITGIHCDDGTWFPFGFANCPEHGPWFGYNDKKKGIAHAEKYKAVE